MKILFLLGNGFDMNLELKTSYQHFYENYLDSKSESKTVNLLKEAIKIDVNSWSDLESSLGKYIASLTSEKQFMEVYYDLLKHLGDYLDAIETNTKWVDVDVELLKNYLYKPESVLPPRDSRLIRDFKTNFKDREWFVDVITFNYTNSFESLFSDNFKNVILGYNSTGQKITLRDVQHVHGYINDGMVLGVNDLDQMHNEEFKKIQKITNTFIKANNNRRQGHYIDEILAQRISQAKLICIFGCSIGDTDNIWWEKIGNKLLTDKLTYLIIFTKPAEKIEPRYRAMNNDWEETIRERFKSRTKLNTEELESIDERIFVRSDTEMFKNILPPKQV